jgi:dimethylglycine dehydrogenase
LIGWDQTRADPALPGTGLLVKMLHRLRDAMITEDSPYDPKTQRNRVDG